MRNKMLIFGGGGFVGRNLAYIAKMKLWDVSISDSFYPEDEAGYLWFEGDITNIDDVDKIIGETLPDLVVNLAAVSDIDEAEQNKELAWNVNVVGAANIAECCQKYGAKYIFFSSDAVFDGNGKMYKEDDLMAPVNYYGVTKMEAEKAVQLKNAEAIIIRVSLIIGFSVAGGNSFLTNLEKKIITGEKIYSTTEEIRTPVDVITLCDCILELGDSSFSGKIHIGSKNSINRFDLTKQLVKKMGYAEDIVHEVKLVDKGRAPRHKNGVIDVSKASNILKTPLYDIEGSITRAVQTKINL